MTFDPRSFSQPVYKALQDLRSDRDKSDPILQKQKNQALQLYTYLSTWGMMRLKAEEKALMNNQEEKQAVVKKFFACLEQISEVKNLSGPNDLRTLTEMKAEEYLGLSGLALAIAREFSFWAQAVYFDVEGER